MRHSVGLIFRTRRRGFRSRTARRMQRARANDHGDPRTLRRGRTPTRALGATPLGTYVRRSSDRVAVRAASVACSLFRCAASRLTRPYQNEEWVPVRYPLGQKSGKLDRQGSGVNGSCRGLTGPLPDFSVSKSHLISVRSEVQVLPGPLRQLEAPFRLRPPFGALFFCVSSLGRRCWPPFVPSRCYSPAARRCERRSIMARTDFSSACW